MKDKVMKRSATRIAWILALLVGFGGCTRYEIETTLSADGSGSRSEEVVVAQTEDSEIDVTPAEYRQLMNVTEDAGWTHESSVDGDDSVYVFRREHRIEGLGDWSDLTGSVRITGARRSAAGTMLGDVRLGDIRFTNSVRLESGPATSGRSFTYRETFYWVNGLDALIGYQLQDFRQAVGRRYSDLAPRELGELVGLLRGGLWAAIDQGLLDAGGEEEDRISEAFVARTAEQAALIVGGERDGEDEKFFSTVLDGLMDDDDGSFEAFLREKLTGVELAVNTEIEFRLTMPGRVVDTNAEEREGNTLIWKFGPGDALTAPMELYARWVVDAS